MPDVSAIMAEMLARARAANAPQASPNHPVVVPGLGRKKSKTVEASVDLKQIEDFFNRGDEEKAKATDKLFEVWNMMGADPDAAPAREALFSNPVIQKQLAERFGKDPRIIQESEPAFAQSPIQMQGGPKGWDQKESSIKVDETTGERFQTTSVKPAEQYKDIGGSDLNQFVGEASKYRFVDLAAPEKYQRDLAIQKMTPEMREKQFREPSKDPLDFFSGQTATDEEIDKFKANTAISGKPGPIGPTKNAQKVLDDWNAYYLQVYGKGRDQLDPKDAEFNYQNTIKLGGKARQTVLDLRAAGGSTKEMSGVIAGFKTSIQKEFKALDPKTPSNIEKMKHYVTLYENILKESQTEYAGDYSDLIDFHNYLGKIGAQGYGVNTAVGWLKENGFSNKQIEQIGRRTTAFKEAEAQDKIRRQAELDQAQKIFKNAQIYLEDRKKSALQRALGAVSRGYFGVLRGEAAYKWAIENGPKYGLYLKGGKDER